MKSVVHSTILVERKYPASIDRVYGAFADRKKKQRWYLEGGHAALEEYEMDFRVGGVERAVMRFQEGSPFPGLTYGPSGVFQDIQAEKRIVVASVMMFGDKRISASLTTFEFIAEDGGTKLILTDQVAFFEGADGPAMREQGWNAIADNLGAALSA